MWAKPTKEDLKRIPKLYSTERVKDKTVYLHFFCGGSDWYVAEWDGEDIFFGFAIINGDTDCAEWGYVSFKELQETKGPMGLEVDTDKYWTVRKVSEIDKIRDIAL